MIRRALPFMVGSLLLLSGCGGGGPTALTDTLCGSQPGTTRVIFEDANLAAAIKAALALGEQCDLTCDVITTLTLHHNTITDLTLFSNFLTDIGPLGALTGLTQLTLFSNSINDISALHGLTGLGTLVLSDNPDLSNIQPLLDNPGLGAGDFVYLEHVDPAMLCEEVALLQAKGVDVIFDGCT